MSYAIQNNKKDHVTLKTKDGNIVIKLFPREAPNHVKRIQELVEEGFYNGLKFHRVIDGFMAQTGCPHGNGTGGSDKPNLKAEFNDMPHLRGTVSMARAMDPHSANSQFFIVLENAPHLNRQYTAFGQVISGMEYVDKIKKGDDGRNGAVQDPDSIVLMHLGTPDELESSSDHAAPSPFIN